MALVEDSGFEARVVGRGAVADSDSAILRVSGMTCSSCSSAVELALLNHQGVQVDSIPSYECICTDQADFVMMSRRHYQRGEKQSTWLWRGRLTH